MPTSEDSTPPDPRWGRVSLCADRGPDHDGNVGRVWIIHWRTAVVLCLLVGLSGCAHAEVSRVGRALSTASASGPCTWQRESGNPNARYLGTPPPTGGEHLRVRTMTR